MLFHYTIKNWADWGNVFQLIEEFTPLAQEIFHREQLEFTSLENLTLPAPMRSFARLIPPVDLLGRVLENTRLERLPDSLRAEMSARAASLDLTDTVLVLGDLTGENILVDEGGSLVIIDCADACLAPWWYKLAPLVFELFHCREDLLRMFVDTDSEVFVERVLDAVCIHDFGANMLLDLAEREKVPGFSHLMLSSSSAAMSFCVVSSSATFCFFFFLPAYL